MINRRKAVCGIVGSAAAALTVSSAISQVRQNDAGNLEGLVPESEEAEQLLYELARLEARYYAEEGTAMVLACENLASPALPSFQPNELNERFTAGFRHYTALLAELRTDLSEQDVAAVVELLAYRDLVNAGGEE